VFVEEIDQVSVGTDLKILCYSVVPIPQKVKVRSDADFVGDITDLS